MIAGGTMAKKKSGEDLKLGAVKIERDIISKAKMISTDRGMSLAGYLSESLRGSVDRDWSKMVRKAGGGGEA
ncbi:MAG: hypothetical protein ACHRXM_26395 [Isosphaerales bacterium]